MKANLKEAWPAILILLVAAVARFTLLSMKPPHFDEGVNGWFVDQISRTGYYHYDPTNYHGPLHFYILFLFQRLFGRHIWALRMPLVLASLGAVWFTMKFDRFMGRKAALWAAAAMAVSPGCVFYGRYAIHEYWLVLSLMAIAWGMAGLWKFGENKYLWAIWIGVTGSVLTKETYIIHFACAAAAMGLVIGVTLLAGEGEKPAPRKWTATDMTMGAVMFVACVVFFYSGAFMDVKGLKGLYTTFAAWAKTGQNGNGHDKPWEYWLKLCALYEWPSLAGIAMSLLWGLPPKVPRAVRWGVAILGTAAAIYGICGNCASLPDAHIEFGKISFAHAFSDMMDQFTPRMLLCIILGGALVVAMAGCFRGIPPFIRGLGIYGCGALAAYSIVNYKTPWCIVSLTWPFLMLFGYGVAWGMERIKNPVGSQLVMSAAVGLLAASTYRMVNLNYFHYTDAAEDYVYVQTFNDVYRLMDPLDQMVKLNPENYQLRGYIMLDSYHPLPWLLGDFPNIGYYDDDRNPDTMDADFLLVEDRRIDEVEAALKDQYFTTPLRLRDAQDESKLYLRVKKFRAVFPGRKPDFIPGAHGEDNPAPDSKPQ